MVIQNYKVFHFIGCGGAGMVGLAIIMHEKGFNVTGSDLNESANTVLLKERGIQVFKGHSPANIPRNDKSEIFIVRSSAISDINPEFAEAVSRGCRHLRRGEFLAELAETYKCTIAIAGCHGKTSVTGILTHILMRAAPETETRNPKLEIRNNSPKDYETKKLNPGYMIGGKVAGWKYSGGAGDGNVFVTESDESDGTQIHLKSDVAVVNNVEDDHSWNVGGEEILYNNFAKFAKNSKKLIYAPCPLADRIFAFHENKRGIDLESVSAKFADMKDWGGFQRINAAIAVEAATEIGIVRKEAEKHARTFPGIERRMSVRFRKDDFVLIEDYAHHPTEVSASISALRERFPGYHLRVVFQPHRYARLEKYIGQLACELRKADEVLIVPVFAAWTEKGKVSSEDLVAKTGENAKSAYSDWKSLAEKLSSSIRKKEILAIIGAGDIDELVRELIGIL